MSSRNNRIDKHMSSQRLCAQNLHKFKPYKNSALKSTVNSPLLAKKSFATNTIRKRNSHFLQWRYNLPYAQAYLVNINRAYVFLSLFICGLLFCLFGIISYWLWSVCFEFVWKFLFVESGWCLKLDR